MESYRANRLSMFVINADDATRLLQIKHILPHRTTVNIQGTVTAVSEIIRINKDCVFMVELQGGAKVIVKQPQFHKWHEQLVIGNSFVFTNLRPTSLSEAYQPQQRVFIPWTGSRLYCPTDDTSHLAHQGLQEWLSQLSLCLPEEEESCVGSCGDDSSAVGICNSLNFHQGVVTDTSQSEFGIFELENKTRLFLCYLPKLKQPKEVCVGNCVTLHNVHQSVCSQTGEKQLFCCTRSTVRVAGKKHQAGMSSTNDSRTVPDPSPVTMLLQQFAVSQSDLPSLLQLYHDICPVVGLQHADMTRGKKKEVKTALKFLSSSLCSADRQRNYILEFCQHKAFCPLSSNVEERSSGLPELTTLTRILRTGDDDSHTALANNSASTSSHEDTGWKFNMEVVDKHLLGWLTVNATTGRLQLKALQCAMDVVIVGPHTPPHTPPHHCQPLCHCTIDNQGHPSLCPYFHPCCLGRMIVVKNFTVVSETFLDVSESGNRIQEQSRKQLSYLAVAAQDCVRLKIEDSRGKTTTSESKYSLRKCTAERTDRRNLSGGDIRLVYITEKCHPVFQTTRSRKHSCVQFCVEGVLVTSRNTDSDKEPTSAVAGTDTACDKAPPAKKTRREGLVSDKQPAVEEKCVGELENMGASSSTSKGVQTRHCSLPQCLQTGQPVSLTFEEGGCGWFDIIHPPGLYRFRNKEGADPFQWPQVDAKLQTAMERTRTRMAVKVSASAAIDRVFQDCIDERKVVSLSSLQSALSDGRVGQLVSLRAVITWHRHPPSQLPEVRAAARTVGDLGRRGQKCDQDMTLAGFLDSRSLCVGVRDEKDPSVTATIYISFSSLIYPVGLLPGAVVDFHRLEKKTSKANNFYFSYLPVSSLVVVSVSPTGTLHRRPAVNPQRTGNQRLAPCWDDAPVWLLVDVWLQPEVPGVFAASCHVCQFFRLSLKSVCGQCGALFQPGGCSAPACLNTHYSSLLPRISVLVEDGSCQALVSINKNCSSDVARRLLRMSPTQWQLLESALQQQGEVFLQKFGCGGGSAVEDLLSLMCDSHKIKRPCWLMLRKPLYPSKPGKATTSMLEALTADDVMTRNINTGEGVVETLCLPYLHLDCLDIRDV
ncbi:hypothetical protein ACOMHN_057142 [Nucella lapillus]